MAQQSTLAREPITLPQPKFPVWPSPTLELSPTAPASQRAPPAAATRAAAPPAGCSLPPAAPAACRESARLPPAPCAGTRPRQTRRACARRLPRTRAAARRLDRPSRRPAAAASCPAPLPNCNLQSPHWTTLVSIPGSATDSKPRRRPLEASLIERPSPSPSSPPVLILVLQCARPIVQKVRTQFIS